MNEKQLDNDYPILAAFIAFLPVILFFVFCFISKPIETEQECITQNGQTYCTQIKEVD